jgi:Cytochrome P460
MKRAYGVVLFILITFLLTAVTVIADPPKTEVLPAPNGIRIPEGYKNWRLLSSSHRTDNNTLRVILGNDIAIEASRSGRTNPWPDGSVLAKLVWKEAQHEKWPTAIVPGKFVHAEFMIKDAKKWPATGGWGFGRWLGLDQQPYGKDAGFVQECYGCHIPMQQNDYVYTHPSIMP